MVDTVTVEVLEDFYDAGAGTYRHADETFEIGSEFAENNPRLVAPADDGAAEDDVEVCGAPLTSGGTCDRPAASCPYHSDDSSEN